VKTALTSRDHILHILKHTEHFLTFTQSLRSASDWAYNVTTASSFRDTTSVCVWGGCCACIVIAARAQDNGVTEHTGDVTEVVGDVPGSSVTSPPARDVTGHRSPVTSPVTGDSHPPLEWRHQPHSSPEAPRGAPSSGSQTPAGRSPRGPPVWDLANPFGTSVRVASSACIYTYTHTHTHTHTHTIFTYLHIYPPVCLSLSLSLSVCLSLSARV